MKAVLFDKVGSVKLGEIAKPDLEASRDAIVRITHASICGSDLNIVNGKIVVEEDAPIGHEGIGVVEKIGPDVKRVKPGDRVVISYSVQCGECENCKNKLAVFCENGGMFGHGKKWGNFGGCQAEYLRVPWADANVEPIPEGVTEEQAMLISDNLSTGYQACDYASIKPGDVVAVFGAGSVGLCALACARLFGPSLVISIDTLDYRLEVARKMGADFVINATTANVAEEIKKITNGKGADVAIEAVGVMETFDACMEAVKRAGTISILGVFPLGKVPVSLRDILNRNLQVKAGRANMINMGRLMSLVRTGKLDVTPIITHHMPLSEAVAAYRVCISRSDNVLKVILTP
jgi:alcohol dehydrogenase